MKLLRFLINRDIESDLNFKIIDFGLATFVKPGEKTFLYCGSPGYTAPEVLYKKGCTLNADVFSCGVILYILYYTNCLIKNRLTGISPFSATTVPEILANNKKCEITYPSDLWSYVSPRAKDLVQKMLEMNPEKRISSQEALQHNWFTQEFRIPASLALAIKNLKNQGNPQEYFNSFNIS